MKISICQSMLISLIMITLGAAAQKRIPDEVQFQIDNYKSNAIKNRNIGNDNSATMYLNKVAFLYWEYFLYDEAVKNFEEVLTINQELDNKAGVRKVLDNMAFVYSDMERYDKAIECFTKSNQMYEATGNNSDIASSLSNLALAYSNNAQSAEAVKYAERGLALSQSLNNIKLMRSFYGTLYESYQRLGNKEKSMEYFSLYSSLDRHIQQEQFNERDKQSQAQISQAKEEKDKAVIAQLLKEKELKFTQDSLKRKELQLELSRIENEANEASIKAKEIELQAEHRLVFFLILIFIVMLLFAFYVYTQMQQKKKANKKLQALNKEIEKKNKQILDSINYASHIQEAILPFEKSINQEINQSFIFYKPRDIVSGDFYWFAKHDDKVCIAAIDCTGHGVPGAFMSMIGHTLLNEIVNEQGVCKPSDVLHLLNEKVVDTLNQDNKDQEGFSEDGMDITFCVFDKQRQVLELALANHSATLYIDGNEMVIEGDIFSIGGNVGNFDIKYTNHTIELTSSVVLYMYSDGFQDQFGGPENKKFMASRFNAMLKNIQNINFIEQKQKIEQNFNLWKGEHKQVDDVLVIGLRFENKK